MATRTIQFLGQGYASTPITVAATYNGNVIYSGNIPTEDSAPPTVPGFIPSEIMFTTDIDVTSEGETPMSIEVTSETGILQVGPILANYAKIFTQVGNTIVTSSAGPNSYSKINISEQADSRGNVLIDGVAPVINRTPQTIGTWCYQVPAGSTISCMVEVDAGQA